MAANEYPPEDSINSITDLHQWVNNLTESARKAHPGIINKLQTAVGELKVAEEKLHQKNEELIATSLIVDEQVQKYQELFHFAPDAYLVTDQLGTILEVNKTAEELLNSKTDKLSGKALANYIAEAYRGEFNEQLTELPKTEHLREWDLFIQPLDGEHVPVAVTVEVMPPKKNDFTELRWILRDISERKKTEVALRESENRLRILVQNLPVMVDALDEHGNITVWNRECERVTGYLAAEMIDNPHSFEMLYPDDAYREQLYDHLDETGADFRDQEWELVCKDGSKRCISWSNISARFPIPGWSTWAVGVDVTERKLAEEELDRYRHHLEEIISARTLELSQVNQRLHREITERQKVEEDLQRTNKLITALSRIASQLQMILDPQEIMQTAGERLNELGVITNIALFDPSSEVLTITYTSNRPAWLAKAEKIVGTKMLGFRATKDLLPFWDELVQRKKPVFAHDLMSLTQAALPLIPKPLITQIVQFLGINDQTRLISLPLVDELKLLGVIWFWGQDLQEIDIPPYQIFASHMVLALENARLFGQVSSGRQRLQAINKRLVQAQEFERRRIARELHDEIGQTLTGLNLLLTTRDEEDIQKAQEIASELMDKVQDMTLDLRPSLLDDLGLLPTLSWHFERFTNLTHIQVEFDHADFTHRFSPEIELTVYRIIQEALTNVARYANVMQIKVRLWLEANRIKIQVDDHGIGFDVQEALSGNSSGLSGMKERVAWLGGSLEIDSTPGSGTTLRVTLPIEAYVERREHER